MAADNKLLGQFDLVGIPPAPRGVPQIEVTFDIDPNGIVNVSAKDKATGKEQTIRIQASGGLSDDDIERMVKEAEQNAEADKKRRALVEAQNQADGLIHATEKTLAEHGEGVSAEDKAKIEADVEALREAMKGDDPDDINAKVQALQQSSMKMGEAMYKAQQEAAEQASQAGPGADADAGTGGSKADDGVVDADFEEVDDSKKNQ
jgi:molecular chaperone DnaK